VGFGGTPNPEHELERAEEDRESTRGEEELHARSRPNGGDRDDSERAHPRALDLLEREERNRDHAGAERKVRRGNAEEAPASRRDRARNEEERQHGRHEEHLGAPALRKAPHRDHTCIRPGLGKRHERDHERREKAEGRQKGRPEERRRALGSDDVRAFHGLACRSRGLPPTGVRGARGQGSLPGAP